MSLPLYRVSVDRLQRLMNTVLPVLANSPRTLETAVSGGGKGSSGQLAHKQSLHGAIWLGALTQHWATSALLAVCRNRRFKASVWLVPADAFWAAGEGGQRWQRGQRRPACSHKQSLHGASRLRGAHSALGPAWVGRRGPCHEQVRSSSSLCPVLHDDKHVLIGVSFSIPAILQCAQGTWYHQGLEHQDACPRATLFQYVLQPDR